MIKTDRFTPGSTCTFDRHVLQQAARFEFRARCYERLMAPQAGPKYGLVMPSLHDGQQDSNAESSVGRPKYSDEMTRRIVSLFSEIAVAPPRQISIEVLHEFHRKLATTDPSDKQEVGSFRQQPVRYGEHYGANQRAVQSFVEALFRWAENPNTDPLPQLSIANALIKAIVVHVELLNIHPYADGNGRVARAVEFAMLVRGGVPLSLAHELHNLYNEDRSVYVQRLNDARSGDINAFLNYALIGLNRRLEARVATEGEQQGMARRQLLRAGFTLVELVVVILILGILAGVATPRLLNATASAEESAEKEIVRRIRDGLELYYLELLSDGTAEFPSALDAAASSVCSPNNPCFGWVLKRGVQDGRWQKLSPSEYQAPSGNIYEYDSASGEFNLTADAADAGAS